MLARQGAGAALRWTRAGVLAVMALAISAIAHMSAGGALPGPLGLILTAGLTTAVFATLLGRPAARSRIVFLLAFGQAVVHGVFTALSGHGGAAGHAQHLHANTSRPASAAATDPLTLSDSFGLNQLLAGAGTTNDPVGVWVTHLHEDLTAGNGVMALAHLAAAVVVGALLAAGERAVWVVVSAMTAPFVRTLLRLRVALLVASGVAEPGQPAPALNALPDPASITRLSRILSHAVVRRGPPGALAPA